MVDNVSPSYGGVPEVKHVVAITSASYAALGTKDPNTLYVVSGSTDASTLSPYSGSIRGNVSALSIASSTASMDCSLANFFTLTLASGTTHINPTNVLPGQTINLLVTTVSGASASFSSNVKQPGSSPYTPTTGSSTDVLTFVSWDSSNIYLASVNNMI